MVFDGACVKYVKGSICQHKTMQRAVNVGGSEHIIYGGYSGWSGAAKKSICRLSKRASRFEILCLLVI
jgi:hypothetical protein